jgi:hypothetical protein
LEANVGTYAILSDAPDAMAVGRKLPELLWSVQAPTVGTPPKPRALRGGEQSDGGEDGDDEAEDVELHDVAAADQVGDDASHDRAEDTEDERHSSPIR